LRRKRDAASADSDVAPLTAALASTLNGIAQGLRNTG